MSVLKKFVSRLSEQNNTQAVQDKATEKPRFESVLKQSMLKSQSLKCKSPGISQTQEAFAREWRKSNNLSLV